MFIIPPLGHIVRKDALLTQLIPAGLVFLVLLLLTLLSWQSTQDTLESQRARALEKHIESVELALSDRIFSSSTLLRAGTGLFDASSSVSSSEWQHFYQQYTNGGRIPGVSVVAYVPLVPASQRAAFEADIDREYNNAYSVQTEGDRDLLAPVQYAVLFQDDLRSPVGYDMLQTSERRNALMTARDTGKITMSSVVTLPSTSSKGVVMVAPLYYSHLPTGTQEERRLAIRGYVYVALRLDTLFEKINGGGTESFGYAIRDLIDNKPVEIYRSDFARKHAELSVASSSKLNLYGRTWQMQYYATGSIVPRGESAKPLNVLLTGFALSFIASVAVFFLIKYRTRMFAIAEEQKLQEAKDELLSLASHQLRTPATGVKQYIGMVLDGFAGPLKKDQSRLLEQAYKSNERQLQIINEFLYVAKLGSGSLTTTRHEFDLAPVVRDVYAEMKLDIQDRGHKVKLKVPRSVPIFADQHSIRMIIENLLSNALKYTPPGGEVSVTVVRGPREVQVSIADTGVGIDRKDLRLLFKQFSRIPNELSAEVSGSGIGLYLAQQLAIRNGGNITVMSERGKGSTFTLHIPVRRVKNLTKTSNKA